MLKLDFERAEYDRRIEAAQTAMASQRLDAVVFTTEANIRYFTGYTSHRWLQPTSPQFGVLPRSGPPILHLPTIELDRAGTHPWLQTLREFRRGDSPLGVGTLAATLRELDAPYGRVGAELGGLMRMGMPYGDFDALRRMLGSSEFVDASPLIWQLRMRKSPAEIVELQRVLAITADAVDALFHTARPGMSERELHAIMVREVMDRGADAPGSMPVGSRSPNETLAPDTHLRRQTDRRVAEGDIVWLDAGCVVNGYWADTMRMFCIGKARQDWKDAYAFIREAVEDCIAASVPGAPTSAPVKRFQARLETSPYREFLLQRFQKGSVAHAIGLDLIEPPMMHSDDPATLEPGMVFTIEPFLYQPGLGFFMLEEQVVITETGARVLSAHAPGGLFEAG